MFSSQLGRVTRAGAGSFIHALPHTTSTARSVNACACACLATCATSPSLQPKQRRLSSSSSKASSSSSNNGNSNGAKPLTTDSPASSSSKESGNETKRRAGGRRGRDAAALKSKKSVGAAAMAEVSESGEASADAAFDALPRVAATAHLHPQDLSLSSFFSLHRPLALSTPLPPITTQESFAAIFDSKAKRASAAQNPGDVIYTLSNTLDALESHTDQQQRQEDAADLQWQIIQESPSNADGVKHLDGAPRAKTLEEMVGQLRPFMTPPPPAAAAAVSKSNKQKASKQASSTAEDVDADNTKKSFQTTITVTENTSSDGVKYYTASTSPMVRIGLAPSSQQQQSNTPVQDALAQRQYRHPFLERMRERQLEYEDYRAERDEERSMQLISVKRQRKLKMKKHKYKKLMKRTRNLRRRLDRN